MLKNTEHKNNLNQTVIPRLTGNPAENKAILPLDTRIKPEYDNQSGRSMVEMLGVLAVIGVLSVAGISAYSTAMNKHRANELLNEASKRATVVAMQVASGRTGLTVAEFGNDGWNVTTDGLTNQFGIVSPSVNADVCKQVVNAIGTGTVIKKVLSGATDATGDASKCSDNSITFIYNNDMSTEDVASEPTAPPIACTDGGSECTGCHTCQDGVCKDTQSVCGAGTCTNGSCRCSDNREICGTQCCADGTYCAQGSSASDYICATPSGTGCATNDDCGDDTKYCQIGGSATSTTTGTCEPKGDLTDVIFNGRAFYVGPTMNWWSAQNFCQAHGKKLVSLGSLGLATDYSYDNTGENKGPLYTAFTTAGAETGSFWTSNSYSSNVVYRLTITSTNEKVSTLLSGRTSNVFHALCE